MKTAKTLILLIIPLMLALSSCLKPENEGQSSTEGPVVLEINLGGDSRAERFLGTFDQINRMALDIKRVYGNKIINTDLELSFDNSTGNWKGTVNNLIVGFEYEITGHAYRAFDNSTDDFVTSFSPTGDNNTKFVEIFQGETNHTVNEGLNSLNLRLSPILDSRTLTVPSITHIYRPFQMVASTNDNITVKVKTHGTNGSANEDLSFRFRSVDEYSNPLSAQLGGSFSPSKDVIQHQGGGSYPDIVTTYTAPDNRSTQKIQIRVSNEQEIGVTQHFTINVTDDLDTEHTVDTNPVIESFSAERLSNNELKFVVSVSNDDGFNGLQYKWEYLFGENRTFTQFDTDEDNGDSNRGTMEAVLSNYQDSDSGLVVVTVCEDGGSTGVDGNMIPSTCEFMNEASTSMSFELIPNAYQQPIICDGNDCASEFDDTWIACNTNDDSFGPHQISAARQTFTIGSGQFTMLEELMDDSTCSGSPEVTIEYKGTISDNSSQVYVTHNLHNGDNSTVTASTAQLTMNSVNLSFQDLSYMSGWNDNGTGLCGYNYWTGVSNEVSGCQLSYSSSSSSSDNSSYGHSDNSSYGHSYNKIYPFFHAGGTAYGVLRIDNDTLRSRFSFPEYDNQTSVDSNGYPTDLGCEKFGSQSDGVYVTPECDYSHMSSHSYDNSSSSYDNSDNVQNCGLHFEIMMMDRYQLVHDYDNNLNMVHLSKLLLMKYSSPFKCFVDNELFLARLPDNS